MRPLYIVLSCFLSTLPAYASDDDHGTLNPEELTLNRNVERALNGDVDMMVCASGYMITKSGRHGQARAIFENCANAGYTGTMTWMSYMENNGFGSEYDPDKAAEWDKRAAEAGDPVGKFNHGLNLLRGYGIDQDTALAKRWINEAANEGLEIAQRLIDSGYDPDEVTPDADNWRYAPSF